MLSRFHPIPERHGRTDGQTERSAISILRVSVLTRNKNGRRQISKCSQVDGCVDLLLLTNLPHTLCQHLHVIIPKRLNL